MGRSGPFQKCLKCGICRIASSSQDDRDGPVVDELHVHARAETRPVVSVHPKRGFATLPHAPIGASNLTSSPKGTPPKAACPVFPGEMLAFRPSERANAREAPCRCSHSNGG